jgi:flavodoxin
MSIKLNYENQGKVIALIKSDKPTKKVVTLGEGATHGYNDIKLEDGQEFQIIPDVSNSRFIYYICGQSGSGKSWFCKSIIEVYKKMYPKRDVFLISALPDDAGSLDKLKYI